MPDALANPAAESADPGTVGRRCWLYAAWLLGTLALFAIPVARFVRYALASENASHTILIPIVSLWLVILERKRIFATLGTDRQTAILTAIAATLLAGLAFSLRTQLSELNQLCIYICALILFWVAGFSWLFGGQALRRARFPLSFLLFMVPFPDFLLDSAIYFLQRGTTEIAAVLFDWSGVPVLRDGFVFHLAHANIEVARECSGIRSSLALLILAVLVAHFYLRSFWRQALFVAVGLFVMLLKNSVRVVTLTLLAVYVDPGFLYGRLHHQGGVVFFLLGLGLLAPVLWLLERGERTAAPASAPSS